MSTRPKPLRTIIYPVPGRNGTSYKAEVKGPGTRVYLGTFGSNVAAMRAGDRYILTGQKPAPAKRGPKGARGETWDDVPRQSCSRPARKPATSSPAAGRGSATWREIARRVR